MIRFWYTSKKLDLDACSVLTHSNYIMGWKYVMHVHAKLWMVRLCRVPHSNQDTQVSIESYHRPLKHWFSFETKGLRGHHID